VNGGQPERAGGSPGCGGGWNRPPRPTTRPPSPARPDPGPRLPRPVPGSRSLPRKREAAGHRPVRPALPGEGTPGFPRDGGPVVIYPLQPYFSSKNPPGPLPTQPDGTLNVTIRLNLPENFLRATMSATVYLAHCSRSFWTKSRSATGHPADIQPEQAGGKSPQPDMSRIKGCAVCKTRCGAPGYTGQKTPHCRLYIKGENGTPDKPGGRSPPVGRSPPEAEAA
jgi:hypothetical protein